MATPDSGTKTFLSHSSQDKQFARQLYSSLLAAQISCFIDEMAIEVGESIPKRVFEEIDGCTNLVFVASVHSVASKWAREELDAAQMRRLSSAPLKVLPIVIDDCLIPPSLRHIRYADFREWRDPTAYRQALGQLLVPLGGVAITAQADSAGWYVQNLGRIRRFEEAVAHVSGVLSVPLAMGGATEVRPLWHIAWKHAKWDLRFSHELRDFIALVEGGSQNAQRALLQPAQEALRLFESHDRASDDWREIHHQVDALRDVVEQLRYSVEDSVFGAVALPPN